MIQSRLSPVHKQAGFTLIELLLVLVITALLLAVTPALLHKAFPVLKLRAAARDLVQEIRYVQNAAIINGLAAEIRFDLENGEYHSEQVNGGAVRALPGGLTLSQTPDPRLAPPQGQILSFVFYPDGSANGGEIYLGTEQQRLGIHIDWLTSRIELDAGSRTGSL